MTLHNIENMSAADLKAQRPELVAAAEAADKKELAGRYVQARTDASLRDEKLAEQGETIKGLQLGLRSVEQQNAVAEDKLAALVKQAAEQQRKATEREAALQDQLRERTEAIRGLDTQLAETSERCRRLRIEAGRHAGAIASIAKISGEAVATGQIEAADGGE